MSYEEMKTEIKNAPMSYLPGLLVCVVKTICEKKALKPGGSARIAKGAEDEHAESAVKSGHAEYYLDENNNKQWRWK